MRHFYKEHHFETEYSCWNGNTYMFHSDMLTIFAQKCKPIVSVVLLHGGPPITQSHTLNTMIWWKSLRTFTVVTREETNTNKWCRTNGSSFVLLYFPSNVAWAWSISAILTSIGATIASDIVNTKWKMFQCLGQLKNLT